VAEPAWAPTGADFDIDTAIDTEEWLAHGRCAGKTHLVFPPLAERPQARVRREAKAARICAECPVVLECRMFARLNREHGYWGGESEEERAAAGFTLAAPIGGRTRRRSLRVR
jgi:WhiB family redox-sensing transcriptional regulator